MEISTSASTTTGTGPQSADPNIIVQLQTEYFVVLLHMKMDIRLKIRKKKLMLN